MNITIFLIIFLYFFFNTLIEVLCLKESSNNVACEKFTFDSISKKLKNEVDLFFDGKIKKEELETLIDEFSQEGIKSILKKLTRRFGKKFVNYVVNSSGFLSVKNILNKTKESTNMILRDYMGMGDIQLEGILLSDFSKMSKKIKKKFGNQYLSEVLKRIGKKIGVDNLNNILSDEEKKNLTTILKKVFNYAVKKLDEKFKIKDTLKNKFNIGKIKNILCYTEKIFGEDYIKIILERLNKNIGEKEMAKIIKNHGENMTAILKEVRDEHGNLALNLEIDLYDYGEDIKNSTRKNENENKNENRKKKFFFIILGMVITILNFLFLLLVVYLFFKFKTPSSRNATLQ